jgi:hypothetical protein
MSRSPFPSFPAVTVHAGMHKEEEWTLSRIASNAQKAKANGQAPESGEQNKVDLPAASNGNSPQRRRFVFTDPVAFRWVHVLY